MRQAYAAFKAIEHPSAAIEARKIKSTAPLPNAEAKSLHDLIIAAGNG